MMPIDAMQWSFVQCAVTAGFSCRLCEQRRHEGLVKGDVADGTCICMECARALARFLLAYGVLHWPDGVP